MDKKKMKKQVEAIEATLPKIKPYVSLTDKDLKEVKEWEVGKTYEITIKAKMVGKREGDNGFSGDFDITDIETEEND